MGNIREKYIEDTFVKTLEGIGYKYIDIHNKKELYENIRKHLEDINGRDITLSQLKTVLKAIERKTKSSGHSAFTFNEILLKGIRVDITDKYEEIGSNNKPFVQILDTTNYGNNSFEVIRQYRDDENELSRYDVTILINGFPIIQIELKNPAIEIDEAINQISRYNATAFEDLYKYLQLFIVSNGDSTKYGINNNETLNKMFMFNWSDEKNNIKSDLADFTNSFLQPYNIFDMVTKYIVKYSDKRMIVLRPYQIFAIKAAMKKINIPYNLKLTRQNNGYIFHTTGSGKTLTSWKCVQLASEGTAAKKVVFLVDRKDLDVQTLTEFKSIDSTLDVDETENTASLLKQFQDTNKKFVITTIQKMGIAIKKATSLESADAAYVEAFSMYKKARVVFIIDECHRTQFGEMHTRIDKYFENDIYIGFTGTPIMEENMGNSSMTTADLFGNEIHTYRISNAIKDKNVLGFAVDYINTVKDKGVADTMTESLDGKIDTEEVLMNPTRIKMIVDKIYEIHDKKTFNRRYTALFAVQSISMLLKYYDEFERHNKALANECDKLKVSAIFTASDNDNNELDISTKQRLTEIRNSFNKQMGVKCQSDESFRAELVKGLRADRPDHVDIVIVVGIFLTGFDSKYTNTLYVDKNLIWHGLLQAFSRTNRVESIRKPFGNIVCFRNLKQNVDDAIELFNYGKDSNGILAKSYEQVKDELIETINELMKIVPKNIVDIQKMPDNEKVDFVNTMRKVNTNMNQAKQFTEFDWKEIETLTGMSEDTYHDIVNQFKEIKYNLDPSDKESVLNCIDFKLELVETDIIDNEYIKKLIHNIDMSSYESMLIAVEGIRHEVDKSMSDTLPREKKEVIKKFLDTLILDYKNFDENKLHDFDIAGYFRNWVIDEKMKELSEKSAETRIEKDKLTKDIVNYSIIGKVDKGKVSEQLGENNNLPVLVKRKVLESLYTFIEKFNSKFQNLI